MKTVKANMKHETKHEMMKQEMSNKMNNETKKEEWINLERLALETLKKTKEYGATAAEVALNIESGLSTTVRLGQVEIIEFNHDKSLGLTVYKGYRKGTVSTTEFSKAALENLIEKACRIAEYTEEDKASGLPDEKDLAKTIPNLDLYHPFEVSSEEAIQYAKECEEAALAFDPCIVNSEGASFSTHTHFRVYANSHGFLGSYPSTRHSMSCSVISKSNDSMHMQRAHDYTIARDKNLLDPWKKVGQTASKKAKDRLHAKKLKTCEVPVIFKSEIASSLFAHFISAISGGNLYRQSSFLVDHLGKLIFPSFFQIEEIPHILKALGSAPFDQEGVQNYQHAIVRDGILESYVLGSYSARKLGLKTTGNCGGVHNLFVGHRLQNANDLSKIKDLTALLKDMNRGLLVTELMGQGVNIVTGDYSRGAAGFWVENGEIQYPVEEITIASNLKNMFKQIVNIGNDVETRGNVYTGSVLIERMTVAGS